jgi:lipid-A-disaccharide synthase
VIAYRANALTAAVVRRLIRVERVSLANILLRRDLQPELLQERCRPEALAQALEPMLGRRQADCGLAAELRRLLGGEGAAPSERAARLVLDSAGWRPGTGD